jgi:hypothetical protein
LPSGDLDVIGDTSGNDCPIRQDSDFTGANGANLRPFQGTCRFRQMPPIEPSPKWRAEVFARKMTMGKDEQPLSEPAAEQPGSAPAHDAVPGSAELDAAAVAALQQLGTGPDLGADSASDLASPADHDLLAALHGTDVASNLDHALDQLTHSADLFDMPALDFADHSDAPHS